MTAVDVENRSGAAEPMAQGPRRRKMDIARIEVGIGVAIDIDVEAGIPERPVHAQENIFGLIGRMT